MKNLLSYLLSTVILLGLFIAAPQETSAQSIVRSRVGTNGTNDFYVRTLLDRKTVTVTSGTDTTTWETGAVPLSGTLYDVTADTNHAFVWNVSISDTATVRVEWLPVDKDNVAETGASYTSIQNAAINAASKQGITYVSRKYQYVRFRVRAIESGTLVAPVRLTFYLIGF